MKNVWNRSLKNLFSVWLLTEWNHIIPNINKSTTSFWKIISLVYEVNFRYSFNTRTPVLLQMIFVDRYLSSKTSVAQNCAAFLVCRCYWWLTAKFSLRIPVLMDIRLKHLHKKDLIFIQRVITLSRKWIPGYISVLHIKVSLLQRENTKTLRNRSAYGCYFRK